LGFDVDPLNTVHFSNHTGFPKWKGVVNSEQQLMDIYDGLRSNGFMDGKFYSHLLTGYIGSPDCVRAIVAMAREMKAMNPNLIYCKTTIEDLA
jgi:pyridoxine kinase